MSISPDSRETGWTRDWLSRLDDTKPRLSQQERNQRV